MSYRLDYEEKIPSVVARLKEEHAEIDRNLKRISQITSREDGDVRVALSLLEASKEVILRHAVEEEARLARVIVESEETKKSSAESVKILQEHRRIEDFFKNELPYLVNENSEVEAKKKISRFVDFMAEHHLAEEQDLFPLALKAVASKSILPLVPNEDTIFPKARPMRLVELVNYQEKAIVSKVLTGKGSGTITLFAFDKDQGLTEHTSPFDVLVQVLEGSVDVTIAGNSFQLAEGDAIILPANLGHALHADSRFKMILTLMR